MVQRHAENNLACTSCHEAGAAKRYAIPWVGVTATCPQYRSRANQVSPLEERVNGCMERSMNSKPLPLGAPAIKAFTTDTAFLSKGVPWGPDSFDNGAGMHRLLTAMRFVRRNMPLGASHTATVSNDDEACDATAFVLSKPQPVKAHLDAEFPAWWNKPVDAAFPPRMSGAGADQHRHGPFPPLAQTQKQREMRDRQLADLAGGARAPGADQNLPNCR